MLKLFKKKTNTLYSPVKGKAVPIETVSDQVFSSKMMGDGVAFILEDEYICAPCNGIISVIPPSLHAFGMKTESGVEILIHVGLDTVSLNGSGFKQLVAQGTKVMQGMPILKVDLNYMKEQEIDLTTPMVITNSSEYLITIVVEETHVTKDSKVVNIRKK